jgi:hypothetical protein
MSQAGLCPECKSRPVPAGHYLCAQCEAALVAAAVEEKPARGRRPVFAFKLRPLRPRRAAAPVGGKPRDAKIEPVDPADAPEPSVRPSERPRWVQVLVLTLLVGAGTAWAWTAKTVADARTAPPAAVAGPVAMAKQTLGGVSQAWRKLVDTLKP